MSALQQRIQELCDDPGFWEGLEQPMLPPSDNPVTLNQAIASLPIVDDSDDLDLGLNDPLPPDDTR